MWAPGAVRLACIEQLIVFELCAVWCGLYVDSTACFFFENSFYAVYWSLNNTTHSKDHMNCL